MKINKIAVALVALPGFASALTAPDPAAVSKAAGLLARSDELLANTSTAFAVYTQTDTYPGKFKDLKQVGTVSLARPNELRVEIVRARRIKDGDPWKDTGNNTLSVSGPEGQYAVFFHPHSTQVRKQSKGTSPNLPEAPVLSAFFAGRNTPASLLNAASEAGSLSNVEVNGSEVRFTAGRVERSAEIGSDGLIHSFKSHNLDTQETRTWTLNKVTLVATISPSRFAYTPPADALPYDRGSGGSETLDVGDLAPEFTVTANDGSTIRLSELRGKVVILKFWATWCWPCNQSLPETEAIASAYQPQDVTTVAVSIRDSKKGFDAWVKKHPQYRHIRFAFEDPNHTDISGAYHVRTQPTLYVIGKDGRVTYETEGFTGPNPGIESAIKQALKS